MIPTISFPYGDFRNKSLPKDLCYKFHHKNTETTTGVHKHRATKFCAALPSILSIITEVFPLLPTKKMHQFTSTEQKASDDKTLRKLIQNCGLLASSWNLDTAPWFSENW